LERRVGREKLEKNLGTGYFAKEESTMARISPNGRGTHWGASKQEPHLDAQTTTKFGEKPPLKRARTPKNRGNHNKKTKGGPRRFREVNPATEKKDDGK